MLLYEQPGIRRPSGITITLRDTTLRDGRLWFDERPVAAAAQLH